MRSEVEVRSETDGLGNRLLLIESIRLGFSTAILLVVLGLQIRQGTVVPIDLVVPIYSMLGASYLLNFIYVYFFEVKFFRIWQSTAILFIADAFLVTGLIRYTGVDKSIFLFVYLVNISLVGFVFQRRGALLIAALTSVLFSLILIMSPGDPGREVYFVLVLNNLAFFAVAFLSGVLSEQLNFMGSQISAREEEIKSLRDLNDLIVENITTGLVSCDLTNRVVQANAAAKEILEKKGNLQGVELEVLIPGIDRLLGRGATSVTERFELDYRSPRGEDLILGMSISQLRSGRGHIAGFVLIFQDLTKIKRLERAMRRSEKLAAVGQLAAGIAHEIRNPLASISGSIQLLSTTLSSLSPEDARLMQIMLKEIDRLNRLISEFLDFVKPEIKTDDSVDLNVMLREILDVVKLNRNVRGDVTQTFASHSERKILGHADKLRQCFLNIILNAYQAMENSPEAKLHVEVQDKGAKSVLVKIRDTGQGMSEEVVNRLFEPFFTTKPSGTGLGLAMVHKILENHGAQIHVESRVGVGTEFTLEFHRLSNPDAERTPHDPSSEDYSVALKFQEEMNKFNLRKRGHG